MALKGRSYFPEKKHKEWWFPPTLQEGQNPKEALREDRWVAFSTPCSAFTYDDERGGADRLA